METGYSPNRQLATTATRARPNVANEPRAHDDRRRVGSTRGLAQDESERPVSFSDSWRL